MNQINPRKLLLSKWTAATPLNREKHFLVTELFKDEEGWQVLQQSDTWRMGWK
ncbi:hypothetical protein AO354_03220 [Pseudomonas syringae pv. syringae]|nr:hypothetical protein AO354_03220 [Pseudomonas syringae pv. syringae]